MKYVKWTKRVAPAVKLREFWMAAVRRLNRNR